MSVLHFTSRQIHNQKLDLWLIQEVNGSPPEDTHGVGFDL